MLFHIAVPVVLAAALLLDGLIGDPPWLWSRVPHPVVLAGALIGWADRTLNKRDPATRRWRGILLVIVLVALAGGLGVALVWLTRTTLWGWLAETFVAFSLIAQRDLYDHVKLVAVALSSEGLAAGRHAVARIVGRDPDALDGYGICRAAIESCAENFADGVVAPVFWYLLAGMPGLVIYKAVNTADSMIGHKTERYLAFGWAAARLDDVLNFVPARLSGAFLALASLAIHGARPREAVATMLRDAPRHKSPSAGWPEAAVAGALGLALAGPRRYHDELVRDAWIGQGRARCTPADIAHTLQLYLYACILWGVLAVAALTWTVTATWY